MAPRSRPSSHGVRPSNWELLCSFTLSADDLAQLINCSFDHIHDCLVDQAGRPVRELGGWKKLDHATTAVWFEWPDGLRLRARRNRIGDLMFLTAEARETFGLEISRAVHPSNVAL